MESFQFRDKENNLYILPIERDVKLKNGSASKYRSINTLVLIESIQVDIT